MVTIAYRKPLKPLNFRTSFKYLDTGLLLTAVVLAGSRPSESVKR